MQKRFFALLMILLLTLTACGEKSASRTVYAMDTVMDLRVYGAEEAVLDEAQQLLYDLENTLSRRKETSAVAALNRDRTITDPVVAALLLDALDVAAATDDAFIPPSRR